MDLSELRFGFEYETLVEVKNPLFHPMLQCLKTYHDNGKPIRTLDNFPDNTDTKTIIRFLLASILNNMNNSIKFKATKSHHGLACDTFNINHVPLIMKGKVNDNPNVIRNTSNAWVITNDSSVDIKAGGLYSSIGNYEYVNPDNILENIEFVSPILTFDQIKNRELYKFRNVIQANNSFNHWNNSTTSNHVHVSYDDKFKEPECLVKAAMAWWVFEPVFLFLVAKGRRNNTYCKTMHSCMKTKFGETYARTIFDKLNDTSYKQLLNQYNLTDINNKNKENNISGIQVIFQGDIDASKNIQYDRYVAFNMLNVQKLGTLEVRLKHGSSDMEENTMYIELIAHFFHAVINKPCINITNEVLLEKSWELSNIFEKENYIVDFHKHMKLLSNMIDTFYDFINVKKDTKLFNYWEEQYPFINNTTATATTVTATTTSGGAPSQTPIKPPTKTQTPEYLFSYGSNNTEQLTDRIRRKDLVSKPAYLENHTRIFAGYSKRWDGGVASIHPTKGSRVYGSLVRLTATELDKLDRFESGYTRTRVTVVCQETHKHVDAIAYVKKQKHFTHFPSDAYMQAISKNLQGNAKQCRCKIVVRGIPKSSKETIAIFGTWDPENGLQKKI